MATNVDFGKLATLEFDDTGKDTEQAISLLAAGSVTLPQFSAWSRERDSWIAGRAAGRAQATNGALKFKVSGKGAVSVYGLNARFPVTLYGDQWERLLAQVEALRAFIDAHRAELSVKGANGSNGHGK